VGIRLWWSHATYGGENRFRISVKRVTRSLSRRFYQSLGGWVGHLTTLILKTALDALQWLAKAELVPYYKRAQKACNLGPYEYDFAYWKDALAHLQLRELPFLRGTHLWQIIPPTHFVLWAYRAEIEQARNIDTYLHANVVRLIQMILLRLSHAYALPA